MPQPADPTMPTTGSIPSMEDQSPEARKARYAATHEGIMHLRTVSGIEHRDPAELSIAARKYGRHLPAAARSAADVLDRCGPALGINITGAQLRAMEERAREKGGFKVRLLELTYDVGNDHRSEVNAVADVVLRVDNAIQSVALHPGESATKNLVLDASREFTTVLAQRSESISEAISAGLAKKAETDKVVADNAKLRLDRQYLSGEELRPEDLVDVAELKAPPTEDLPLVAAARGKRGRKRG